MRDLLSTAGIRRHVWDEHRCRVTEAVLDDIESIVRDLLDRAADRAHRRRGSIPRLMRRDLTE